MRSSDVVELMQSLADAGVSAFVAGGWAVDALVGHQTREHADLDLAVDNRDLSSLLSLLERQGFEVTVDWSPSRLELTSEDGRTVDVHPVEFAADGSATQAGLGGESFHYEPDGFTSGTIDGRPVPCLSREQQLRFRTGYGPRPVDVHDIHLLDELDHHQNLPRSISPKSSGEPRPVWREPR